MKLEEILVYQKYQKLVDDLMQEIQIECEKLHCEMESSYEDARKVVEKDLEEIYALTSETNLATKRITFQCNGKWCGLAFDGAQDARYFIDKSKPVRSEHNREVCDYHCVIADCSDASGTHYYEDGIWNNWENENSVARSIVLNWALAKESIYSRLLDAYKNSQQETVQSAMVLMKSLTEQVQKLRTVNMVN